MVPPALSRYRTDVEDSARWDGFDFRAGDIVISAPSKSGTTWTQMICALLVFQTPDLPAPLSTLSPWLDMRVRPIEEVRRHLAAQEHRRFIKTHTPLDGVPYDERVTYLAVFRDPRDVVVSLLHHGRNLDRQRIAALVAQVDAAVRPDPGSARPAGAPPVGSAALLDAAMGESPPVEKTSPPPVEVASPPPVEVASPPPVEEAAQRPSRNQRRLVTHPSSPGGQPARRPSQTDVGDSGRSPEQEASRAAMLAWMRSEVSPYENLDTLRGICWQAGVAWDRRELPNVVLVHYGNLSAGLAAEMRRIAGRLGIAVPEERWPALVEAATFERMSRRPASFAPDEGLGFFHDPARFFRRGGSGEWATALASDDLKEYADRLATLAPPELAAWLQGDRRTRPLAGD
ncbi:MAG TPA: sulfotransferase domain-containing protein [Nocardioidaceae bacterium]|nr:sulfotransferase domain-containing protein [Nocardioidaceae bacterium]